MLFCFLGANAQKAVSFSSQDLRIDWKLITNNYKGEDKYQFSITLTNTSKKSWLPPSGWTIYYNANREVLKNETAQTLETSRIHGDLFYLKPTAAFKGLKAGESTTAEGIGDAWAFNISDAPSGYYLVWDNDPGKTFPITKTTATPPTDINKFKRSPNQVNDQVTPEMVFEQNENITDIPIEQLPSIFPTPVSFQDKPGSFTLNKDVSIQSDAVFNQEANYLAFKGL